MTSIEWLAEQLLKAEPNILEWQKYILQAKEMHKQEMGDTWNAGAYGGGQFTTTHETSDEYYQETFVSNGSDDHIVDTNEMVEDDVWEVGLQDELNKLPYTKHLDDGQYNDGQLAGFELGATWGYNKAKETLYTEEQVREAIDMARSQSGYASYEYKENEIIQSLKQPKK